jgi:hypothetical protein
MMISRPQKTIHEIFLERTQIDHALGRAVQDALRHHKQIGNTIAVWRNGQVVHIPADQIQVPPAEDPTSHP